MELSIKEDNITITVKLKENTVDEAIDAALVVISRGFSEKAVEEALKRFIELAVRNGCLFLFYIVRVVNGLSLDILLLTSGTLKYKR